MIFLRDWTDYVQKLEFTLNKFKEVDLNVIFKIIFWKNQNLFFWFIYVTRNGFMPLD